MSTYSWSYKNAPHRQPAVKKTEAGDETAGDLPRSNTNEKQSQPTALNHFETGKTKRRKEIRKSHHIMYAKMRLLSLFR